jgi:hypothetical protein
MLTSLIHDYKSIITGHHSIQAWIYVLNMEVYCWWRTQGTISSKFSITCGVQGCPAAGKYKISHKANYSTFQADHLLLST